MSVHDGHRGRMRRRFLEYGLDNFSEHEVLEFLLFYSIPRGDVNPLAHRLLDQFGSLKAIMQADPKVLMTVDGIGENTAALLTLMPPMFRRYRLSGHELYRFDASSKLGAYLVDYYIGHVDELMTAVLLDNSCRILGVRPLAAGDPSSVRVDYRGLFSEIFRFNAAGVVIAHNHPNGRCVPSREDFMETAEINRILKKIGVHLNDHIIVAGDDWVSVDIHGRY